MAVPAPVTGLVTADKWRSHDERVPVLQPEVFTNPGSALTDPVPKDAGQFPEPEQLLFEPLITPVDASGDRYPPVSPAMVMRVLLLSFTPGLAAIPKAPCVVAPPAVEREEQS